MGNLVQILTARRLQDAGHIPFALVGGATGMIGDPKESRRAHPELPRRRQGAGSRRSARQIEPFLSFEGDERRDDGEQLRLDREPVDDRLPARHRQALPGQPDAGARRGAHPARGRHLLHRVQLRPAAVDGLPQPVPRPRRHAAVRRQRPVGQHHRRRRADPARRRRRRCTRSRPRWSRGPTARSTARPRAAPCGSTRRCCRRTPSTSSGSTSRTRRSASCCASSRSSSRDGDRGARGADRGEAVPARRPEGAGRARDHAGARRRRRPSRSRPRPPRCSAAAT